MGVLGGLRPPNTPYTSSFRLVPRNLKTNSGREETLAENAKLSAEGANPGLASFG